MTLLLIIVVLLVCCGAGGWWGYDRYYNRPGPNDTQSANPYAGRNDGAVQPSSSSTSVIDGRTVVSRTTIGGPIYDEPAPVAVPEPQPFFGGHWLWIILAVVLLLILAGGGYYGYEYGFDGLHSLR